MNSTGKVIDLSVEPRPFGGYEVVHHNRGQWDLGTDLLAFVLTDKQKSCPVPGHVLMRELQDYPGLLLNAVALELMFEKHDLIPDEWKRDKGGRPQYITFWGTEYKADSGGSFVRCLSWERDHWSMSYRWLGLNWDACGPAAVLLK